VRIDRKLARLVTDPDTEELSVRVRAQLPADELVDRVRAIVEAFERDWYSDPNVSIPPPEALVSAAPPDAVITLRKVVNLERSFELLTSGLAAGLPEDSQVLALEPTVLPSRWRGRIAFLELRAAIRADALPFGWHVADVATDVIDAAGTAWLRSLAPRPAFGSRLPGGRYSDVDGGHLMQTLVAQRGTAPHADLVSVHGNQFRWLAYWFSSSHVSLIAGTTDASTFHWPTYLDSLIEQARAIEPVIQTAFIHFGDNLGEICASTHVPRKLWLNPSRARLNPNDERAIEAVGLVDAEGLAYLTDPPQGLLPDGWSTRKLGHLTEFRAKDLDPWLGRHPDAATLERARRQMAGLLPPSPRR
jgi:hypothetical protein